MTSSYQSTSFQSSARPVDTFIRQSTVPLIEEDGFSQLTKALSAVNPVLDIFAKKAIEEEEEKGFKLAIDKVFDSGQVGKEANEIRKKDGDDAARGLVGGSIFADRVYSKAISSLYSSQLNADMQQAYHDAMIDTFDRNGNATQRSIKEFTPSDEEFINWRESYIQNYTDKILNDGGDIGTTEFTTNLQSSILNINKLARDENSDYKVARVKSLATNHLDKATRDWLDGNKEEAKVHITDFINQTRLLGLTGSDATEVYEGLLGNIASIGEYYITTADVSDLDEIDDVILGLGVSIPYGNNNGNLTQHPLWQEKIAPVLEKLEDEKYEELTQGPKIDKAKRTIRLEKKLDEINKLPIETEEQRLLYKEEITKLKNDREFSDLNEIFKTNNYQYIEDFTAEILNIRTSMKLREYKDNETPQENLALIKNKIVDLGITDNGILTDLNQAVNIASEYKSIYQIFDTKSKKLFDDIDAFYRSKASSSGAFKGISMNGLKINLGGLDNDSYVEKYRLEQEIDNDFESWINENYYKKTEDGKEIKGPTESAIKKWLDEKRGEIENNIFKIDDNTTTTTTTPTPTPLNTNEAPAFGNQKFEVDNVMNFENRRGAGYGGGMTIDNNEFNLQEFLNQENFPDLGGLAELVRSGESEGSGLYNAYNGGTTDSAGEMNITSKTIAEMEQMQANNEVFAVGAYQFTPGVLREARIYSGIDKETVMTPAVQDRLFWGMLLSGRKRPALSAYLLGQSDDLQAAHEDLAFEFAAIQGPDGTGMYDNDNAGNYATIDAMTVRQTLINARNLLMNR
tara:strand:- start:157 stop:2553 length:2397 start_codon:yes stop_codon:yes gene_type:complete